MLDMTNFAEASPPNLRKMIASDAAELSRQLQAHQQRIFPPTAQKSMRLFTPNEAASFIGIHEGYLRQIVADGLGPSRRPMAAVSIRLMTSTLSARCSTPAACVNMCVTVCRGKSCRSFR